MLAKTAPSLEAALQQVEPAGVEWKLDGVRVQVHRDGDDVAVFTRTLDPVGERMPEVAEAVRALPLRSVILDGEAIALRPDGRPRPFQETASRAASRGNIDALREAVPLTAFFFDVLHLDGDDLIDLPASERLAAIEPLLPVGAWVPRLAGGDFAAAQAFLDDALARGHEGVVVKSLTAPYEAGRRGAGWLKVKPVHTLDLVVLAAEWGHGRRQGWLSNLHLGARDPETGGFVMLGKTFKGLTDELLEWQTARLLELESRRTASTVYVHPQLVVEIAFDGIQTSPRYPGGVALRFARVLRYREDKRPEEADTIETIRMLHAARRVDRAPPAGCGAPTGTYRRSEGNDPVESPHTNPGGRRALGRASHSWRTNMKPIKLVAVFAALAIACVALAGAAGAASTAGTKVSAKLNVKAEVPAPKGGKGTGSFTGTLTGSKLVWKLTWTHALRARERGAHPPRQDRQGRQRRRAAVRGRDLQVGRPRHGDAQGGGAQGAQGRRHVREHPHRQERRRRDPRADRGDVAGTAGRRAARPPPRYPAATSSTPSIVITEPVCWTRVTRSPRWMRASATVTTGNSELSTAVIESSCSVVETE